MPTRSAELSNIQTWNRYAYVANNPLSYVDPLGLDDQGEIFPDCWFSMGTLAQCATSSAAANEYCVFIGLCGSGNSGGGSGGSGEGAPPPSTPPPTSPPSKPVNFPNETLGIPNGMNANFGGPLGAILPSAICGDMGPCPTIGSDFQAAAAGAIGGSVLCQIAEPCGAIEDILLLGGLAVEGGALIYQMGRTQSNEWTDKAKQFAPQDPCSWLAAQKGLPQNQDSGTQRKIVQAQKFLKCRNVSKRIP